MLRLTGALARACAAPLPAAPRVCPPQPLPAAAGASAASLYSRLPGLPFFCDRAVKSTAGAPRFTCGERLLACSAAHGHANTCTNGNSSGSGRRASAVSVALRPVARRCPTKGVFRLWHEAHVALAGDAAELCVYRGGRLATALRSGASPERCVLQLSPGDIVILTAASSSSSSSSSAGGRCGAGAAMAAVQSLPPRRSLEYYAEEMVLPYATGAAAPACCTCVAARLGEVEACTPQPPISS